MARISSFVGCAKSLALLLGASLLIVGGCGGGSGSDPAEAPSFVVLETERFTVREGTAIVFEGTEAIFSDSIPDQAFVEFPLEFGADSVPVTLHFRSEDRTWTSTGEPDIDFRVFVYAGNGAEDTSDWDRGVEVATVSRVPTVSDFSNSVQAHSVDITDAVSALIDAGATHIGVRFAHPTNGEQLWVSMDDPTVEAGPNPVP